jgi:cation diffusion facilitator CzcD-associated flavoprotein CzcO/acetyl esterase/lipase
MRAAGPSVVRSMVSWLGIRLSFVVGLESHSRERFDFIPGGVSAEGPGKGTRYLPRWLARLLTRLLQRSIQHPWIPIRVQRAWTEAAARITRTPPGIEIASGMLGGLPCDRVVPKGADPSRAILYLHGGAYVIGSRRTHRGFAAQIATAGASPVHLLDYRLGPEHKHPASLEDALAAYRELIASGIEPGSIVVAGDSAGGGLAVALATRLRDSGAPLPAGIVILNGWLDLTCSGESTVYNRRRDAGLLRPWTVHGGELYAGEADPLDPELSPLVADLRGLPSTYLQVGTHDLLLSDSDRFADRARAAGVDIGYTRFAGMWHDFQLGAGLLREADEAMFDLERALERIWNGQPLAPTGADPSSNGPPGGGPPRPSIAIIGAGFGGIGLGIQLKRDGFDDFTILERADGVGGVWRDNTYPGATCDVPSHLYSFSFEPNPDWSHRFSPQSEILAYLEGCVRRYGLERHLRFGTEVIRASFDDQAGRWRVETSDDETLEADVLVSACGQLSRPAVARISGAESFDGPIFHTARWDHSVDLEGKRVAVIGTGASTIQVVPGIADRVGRLDVYQRSAPYVIPKNDRPYRDWERRLFRWFPPARLLERFQQWLVFEFFISAFNQFQSLGRLGMRMFERNLHDQVRDPELKRALTPDHVLGCKRVLISPDYYSTLERPNVELVTKGVRELNERGVVAEDDSERPADVVVLSIGFDSTRFLAPMEIRGRGGVELNEVWRDGANAYLGMTVAGFPNFFVMYGPNTNLGSGSIIYQLESQMAYIVDAVRKLATGLGPLSVKRDVQEAFGREMQERLSTSVWQTGCNNWYIDERGRNTNNWPGFTLEYRWRTRRLDPSDFEEAQLSTSGV